MCGIYGMVGGEPATVLPAMAAALAHRGPDGEGNVVSGPAALGCRRLAIVDVEGGAQPFADESGNVVAVCNGEIYNSGALRTSLAARGHRFRSLASQRCSSPPARRSAGRRFLIARAAGLG
jgi:asparagine synthase (glutamine-hydrolysing)